jgi:hypothetical protein
LNLVGKGGGKQPGAGRPRGATDQRTREFADTCRDYLDHKIDGIPRWESIVETLLHPIIECRRASTGLPIPGTEYLVNAATILGTLELVAGYGHGRPRQQIEHSGDVRSRFVLESPGAMTPDQWLAQNASARVAMDELDGAPN